MPFKITYTERFLKHYEALNSIRKKATEKQTSIFNSQPITPISTC